MPAISRSRVEAPKAPRAFLVAASLAIAGSSRRALSTLACVALAGAALQVAAQPGSGTAKGGSNAASPTSAAKVQPSRPLWRELTARQQRALEPLASTWDDLTEPHKRKWLAISRDYAKLSPTEQEVLHSRMTEWARLSNQEREQARLNFAVVKQMPPDERKAKWEAYQALSEEEKRKLAARAATARPPGAAPVTRPAATAEKFAPVPALALDAQRQPRIQLAPQAAARAPVAIPAPSSAPVPAEAQVPAPTAAATPSAALPSSPAVRVTEQPSSAP